MRYPEYIEAPYSFPPVHSIRMNRKDDALAAPATVVRQQTLTAATRAGIRPGHTVAVGAGSRGIAEIQSLVAAVCGALTTMGAHPVIIPAMGSHGGASAAGQKKVLAGLGITEENCGAPIQSRMDVRQVGTIRGDIPVWYAADALDCDHSVCINRVKPHTKFKGPVESGLHKMLAVGMGKHQGALTYHEWSLKYGFTDMTLEMGQAAAEKSNFRFALAVVENAREQISLVETVDAGNLADREPLLMAEANRLFPRLPFSEMDVLAIGCIGKEISGAGMDPNITGRAYDLGESDFSTCLKASRVVILDLSDATDGNAIGLGNADIITRAVMDKMDEEATLMNALTSRSLRKAFIPVRLPTEEKAIQAGLTTIGPLAPEDIRLALIENTRQLDRFWVSGALVPELQELKQAEEGARKTAGTGAATRRFFEEGIEIGPAVPLPFDAEGYLQWDRLKADEDEVRWS